MSSEYRSEIAMNANRNLFWLVLTSVLSEVSPHKRGHRRQSAWRASTSLCCQVMSYDDGFYFLAFSVRTESSLPSFTVFRASWRQMPPWDGQRMVACPGRRPTRSSSIRALLCHPREDAWEPRNDRGKQGNQGKQAGECVLTFHVLTTLQEASLTSFQ